MHTEGGGGGGVERQMKVVQDVQKQLEDALQALKAISGVEQDNAIHSQVSHLKRLVDVRRIWGL
jgi:Tfp pilus assembly protein PilN